MTLVAVLDQDGSDLLFKELDPFVSWRVGVACQTSGQQDQRNAKTSVYHNGDGR